MSKLNELESKLAEIQQEINKLKEKPKPEKPWWRPKEDEDYFLIYSQGSIGRERNLGVAFDHSLIEEFNYYQTKEIAEQEAKVLRAYRKLRAIARHLNGDWVPDWEGDDNKYLITYNMGGLSIINIIAARDVGTVAFKTKEAAEAAIEAMGEDIYLLF